MAYKSPVEIATDLTNAFMLECENEVTKAVYRIGVNVDKDELLRALAYDRNQYEAGFRDGVAVRPSPKDFISMKWIDDWYWENSDVCCDKHVSELFGKMIKDWREENEQRQDS